MQNVKIILQYDGTEYHGWQMQENGRTIQGELTRAVSLIDQRKVVIHGAGRTDAGVHAEGQVANFTLNRNMNPIELRNAINGNIDRDIRVIHVEAVDANFNSRFCAKRKTYRYGIWMGDVVSPFRRRYLWHHRGPLQLDHMRESASVSDGRHDFTAFTVLNSETKTNVRTLDALRIEAENDLLSIVISADGFLRYMVRTIVGTLVDVGRGKRPIESVESALRAKERAQAGPTAPAAGLTLVSVGY